LIIKLLKDKKLYDKLSKDGRRFVQKEYDWSNQIHKVIAAYKAVLSRGSNAKPNA
jgi:glycosyltransferase involved in cell wall biosynthesis